MSVGWGVRGDYGHEAGARIPGCGAIGWAFGGQMSYGRIVGYTAAASFQDVTYGYGSLFVVGGLWGWSAICITLGLLLGHTVMERRYSRYVSR